MKDKKPHRLFNKRCDESSKSQQMLRKLLEWQSKEKSVSRRKPERNKKRMKNSTTN